MDPICNPYAPGAGTPPPELAGRDDVLRAAEIAIARTRIGHPAKGLLLVGLRGVGKTVLLREIETRANARGAQSVWVEAPESRSLPAVLAPELRVALLRLSRTERAKDIAQRALRALAGFVSALRVRYKDMEISMDGPAEAGLADSGDLEHDLQSLLEVCGDAASAADSVLTIFVDELQYVPEEQLAALVTALHAVAQARRPVMLIGAGLPQLRGRMGKAKSYAERMFDFPEIGPLTEEAARLALEKPATERGVSYTPDAIDLILGQTQRYPYFLQEWGKHSWDVAEGPTIRKPDVEAASITATAALDASFFRVRFDRLTPLEKRYLRAMADLGPGPHRSGEIAGALSRSVSSFGPLRESLIKKGMIYSPSHGDTAFTVPLFDKFMCRIMPGNDWRRE